MNAVLAHSMIGSLTTINGALEAVRAEPLSDTGRALVDAALRRASFLTDQLRDLAAGLPGEAIVVLDRLRRDGTAAAARTTA